MSVPQVAVEQSYNNVQAGIPITVSLQTHSADWITVQFGSQREVAELNIDYEIEYDTNSQFVTITPRQELIDKIDDDGTNIIYVVRGTPLTSDYGETDAFVRRKTSLEVERLTMRDQETTVAVNNRLGLDSLLADWDGRAKVIKNIIDNSDPSSAATRGSLNAYAAMLPPVSLPPYFQNNVQAALSSIATGIFVVMLMAGPATGLPAPTGYVRVDAEPSHLLKFRSTDHYLKDSVTVDNVNGGWWEADPGFHGLDTRAYGAKNDSNHLGTIGTDSTDAIQACINTHFHTIRFPHGWTRFDRKLVPYAGQVWAGVEIRQEDGEQIGGAGLVYGGSLPRSGAAGDNGTGGL